MSKESNALTRPPADGRTRIISAALDAFSTVGFEGASLRQIADLAGVQHQLVVYHFKTKDALWRAAVASIFPSDAGGFWNRRTDRKADDASDALQSLIRNFVRFTVEHPQFHRIAILETRVESDRLEWLLENYVEPYYRMSVSVIRKAQAAGMARPGDAGALHYALIGIMTTGFMGAIEYRRMTKRDPFKPDEVERVIALAQDFVRA